jgi:hypothetical protein
MSDFARFIPQKELVYQQLSSYYAASGIGFWSPFLKGHISLKNWTQRVILRHRPFKGTCFLIKKKEAKVALFGPHLHCKPGQ